MFQEGDYCERYSLVTEGSVRVHKTSRVGREIVLYRVEPGESCVLTTAVALAGRRYPASAVTEVDTHAIAIRVSDFRYAFNYSTGFRHFICSTYASQICDMVELIDAVAFVQVDVRLARWLLCHRDAENRANVSHRQLAEELGSAREVISRKVKEFERRGWVSLARKRIEILDIAEIEKLAAYHEDC